MRYRDIRNMLINSMVNKSNDHVRHLLKPIYMFSVVLLLIGMSCFSILYVIEREAFSCLVRIAGIGAILLILYLFKSSRIDLNKAIFLNALTLSLIIDSVVIHETIRNGSNSTELILLEMSISLLPCIMSGVTIYRNKSIILSFLIIITFTFSAVYLDNGTLRKGMVLYSIVLLGVRYELHYLMNVIDRVKTKNTKLTQEQKALIEFFDLTNEQWKQIREGRLDQNQAIAIVSRLENDLQEKLIYRVKEVIQSEEEIKSILITYHPDLTFGEQECCCFILQGKSVSEIAKIKEVTNSAVTLMRSRIRKKLHLKHDDCLKAYLEKIVRKHL